MALDRTNIEQPEYPCDKDPVAQSQTRSVQWEAVEKPRPHHILFMANAVPTHSTQISAHCPWYVIQELRRTSFASPECRCVENRVKLTLIVEVTTRVETLWIGEALLVMVNEPEICAYSAGAQLLQKGTVTSRGP